ncbi:element excision factor XisI family protein [Calothrix sp. NIES-2098]|uniref:element excision factor XisI family protein n=1 Tax=Calothrix sp. NIES-2098 TaxID=1954171 RepID=UPI000B61389C|nr:XisI protein-like protein [Calothrix sp. NIES-2098]
MKVLFCYPSRSHDGRRVYGCVWTENGVATDLLHKGITQEEIVLAFHPPHARQYTEFAIA